MRSTLLLLTLILISASPITVICSIRQTQNEQPIRLGIDLVTLDVTVTDKHRRPVHNLTEKDFTVMEDGVEQKIYSFNASSDISGRSGQKSRSGAAETNAP